MRRYFPLFALVTVLALAVWFGSRPPDMFSPPGLAHQYVNALISGDDRLLDHLGTVDAGARGSILAALSSKVATSGREVGPARRPHSVGDSFVQPMIITASNGTPATLDVTIGLKSRKVVSVDVR